MITGAHSIIYSTNSAADRAFLRDVLKLTHVDVGDGWLIFGLPQSEVAVHPSKKNNQHELYLLCEDVDAFILEMKRHRSSAVRFKTRDGIAHAIKRCQAVGQLGIYQPRHAQPKPIKVIGAAKKIGKTSVKRNATKRSGKSKRKINRIVNLV